jgi:hypothetical protein
VWCHGPGFWNAVTKISEITCVTCICGSYYTSLDQCWYKKIHTKIC